MDKKEFISGTMKSNGYYYIGLYICFSKLLGDLVIKNYDIYKNAVGY